MKRDENMKRSKIRIISFLLALICLFTMVCLSGCTHSKKAKHLYEEIPVDSPESLATRDDFYFCDDKGKIVYFPPYEGADDTKPINFSGYEPSSYNVTRYDDETEQEMVTTFQTVNNLIDYQLENNAYWNNDPRFAYYPGGATTQDIWDGKLTMLGDYPFVAELNFHIKLRSGLEMGASLSDVEDAYGIGNALSDYFWKYNQNAFSFYPLDDIELAMVYPYYYLDPNDKSQEILESDLILYFNKNQNLCFVSCRCGTLAYSSDYYGESNYPISRPSETPYTADDYTYAYRFNSVLSDAL